MEIVKRNKVDVVEFDSEKIYRAINKAADETEMGVDYELAKEIADNIEDELEGLNTLADVEYIQNLVEDHLMQSDRRDIAKKYILYREERDRLRNQGWEMTDLQRDIYEQKYRFEGESFDEFLDRVSGGNGEIKKLILDKKFMPAGRILAGRGISEFGRKVSLSNCYVLPKIEDDLDSIFDTAKNMAKTYARGGGVGVQLSKLRPKGALVQNSAKSTTGSVSFMSIYDITTKIIGQNGRRSALMLNLDVGHPDIEEFISVKNDLDKITSANISVNVSDEFMNAVKDDTDFELKFTVDATGENINKTVKSRDLFRKLAENNFNYAEPGLLMSDRIDSWHLMSEDGNFEFAGVNPCAEEVLPAFGSCNLSSINLSEFVKNQFTDSSYFDFNEFSKVVKEGVTYLNEILDENMELHPLKEQIEVSKNLRQIGLGIFGLGDLFIKLGITYGSDKSVELVNQIGSVMANSALQQSSLLAKEHGTFPLYNKSAILKSPYLQGVATKETIEVVKKYGLRNSQILTIPPTGSTSTLLGVSNGIEPVFQLNFFRRTESLHGVDTRYEVFTQIVKDYMEFSDIKDMSDLPEYFVISSDIHYKDRIKVQGAWQKYIDSAISSTINLPKETTVEEIEDLYIYAWEQGLKGTTVYRSGCLREGVLTTSDTEEENTNKTEKSQEVQEEGCDT